MKVFRRVIPLLLVMALIATGLLSSGGIALAQQTVQDDAELRRTISVSGVGQVNVRPDVAVARLGVRTDADTAQEALNQNNESMQALLVSLQDDGIDQADIQTLSVQLFPRYSEVQSPQAGPSELAGFTASNTVEVRVRDLDSLGEILDNAVSAGGNTIEGIHFEVSDIMGLQDEALEEALDNARQTAERLASLANGRLGEIVSITKGGSVPVPFGVGGDANVAAESVPVEPGTQTVSVNLQVTWLLEPLTAGEGEDLPGTGATAVPTQTATALPPTRTRVAPSPTSTPATPSPTATAAAPNPTGTAEPTAAPVVTLEDFMDILRGEEAEVQQVGSIRQPFFPVRGQILRVNGAEVQVFEFEDEASRQAVSRTISETGGVIGSISPNWTDVPHFWAQGRLIVLYIGQDEEIIDLLSQILGRQITEG